MSALDELVALHGDEFNNFHPYVLGPEIDLNEAASVGLEQEVICLVVMKRMGGLLLALPSTAAGDEVRQRAQSTGPDEVLGPSTIVDVAAAIWNANLPLVPPQELEGQRISILLMDMAGEAAAYLKEVADSDLLDVKLFSEDPTLFPLPEAVLDAALSWIHNVADDPRVAFYSADEGLEEPTSNVLGSAAKAKAKARLGSGGGDQSKQKKRVTVASLAETLERMATTLPSLADQIQTLTERTARLEQGVPNEASPSGQPVGGFPMRGLSGTPNLSSFMERMPPPRSSLAQKAPVQTQAPVQEEVAELAEDFLQGDSTGIAKALLAQSSAITTLVSQMASSSGDLMQDMSSGSQVVSSRGAAGRAKLQQELASQRDTFFQMIFQQMARRMQPALSAELTPKQLADRGVTATQYLERFGGYGKVRDIGQIAWQVGIALDHMQ